MMSLDVEAPDQVAAVLRAAAEAYRESASVVSAAWQDHGAGAPWTTIADELERAAERIERRL